MFFGVSIVADRFMAAIEVITSQEREVKLKKITGEPYTILIRIWNETVSNLTLIALGIAVPSPEKRMVQHNSVFWVTVAWSTFAYIWLYLIISVFSPGVIQVFPCIFPCAPCFR
uniref:Sodium/calcium exchanger membrane region domain-containing protein n=1 Tax=Parascaris equorum TaxID=6256 RepID=A0A914S9Q0_PAREQ